MSAILEKDVQKIKYKITNGIRTIIVEGSADKNVYKRFYPNSEFVYGNDSSNVIKTMKILNSMFGKTPLIVGIIDKDIKTEEEISALIEENIFTLGIREIESIFLREDVIKSLFGDVFFQQFSNYVCLDGTNRVSETITNYNIALEILKKKITSKYAIRCLFRQLNIRNKGNNNNIEILCQMMDQTNSWYLVEDVFPQIDDSETKGILKR